MIRVASNVRYAWRDWRGMLVLETETKNLVTLSGCDLVIDLLGGLDVAPTHIAVGTGTGASTAGMTALQAEVFRGLVDRRIKSAQKITFELVLPENSPANGATLGESGIFTGTLMLARSLISPPRVKTGSISLTISHDVRVEGF